MEITRAFGIVDYVIFSATIAFSLGIGVYTSLTGGRQRTTSEYLVGERKLKVLPVTLSLIVSYESSIMMLGFPGETYVYGIEFWWTSVSWCIASVISGFLMVPTFYDLRIVSAYEYLEGRFNSKSVRLCGSFLAVMANLFYMGIVLYGPATALEAVTGFMMLNSILIVAIAGVIYTAMGGIKAVILADAFQTIIMVGGMIAVIVKGTMAVGGPYHVFKTNYENQRLHFFTLDLDPTVRHTIWGLLLGSVLRQLGVAINQTSVQRIATMPSKKKAIGITVLSGPGFFFFGTLAAVEGLVAFAYYTKLKCDPFQAKYIGNPNQIIPYFVMDLFHELPGLPGLFLAALFCASLSTLSSGYASIAAIVLSDFIKPFAPNLSDFRATIVAKCLVVISGALSIAVALLVMTIGGTMSQIAGMLLSAFGGPLVGLFLLGGLFPQATGKGALVGIIVGSCVSIWKGMGTSFSPLVERTPYLPGGGIDNCTYLNVTEVVSNVTSSSASDSWHPLKTFYMISYLWISPLAMVITITSGLIVSLITGLTPLEERDPLYHMPLFDRLMCYLPNSLRKCCRFNFQLFKETKESEVQEMLKINDQS